MQARIILPQMQNYLRARAVPDAGSFAVKTFSKNLTYNGINMSFEQLF